MISRKVEDVDVAYLCSLPSSGLREDSGLEFKLQIGRSEQLCKEICAFANSFGGDLLVGIKEKDGKPEAVPGEDPAGLSNEQFDLKIRQQIRSGVEPVVAFRLKIHKLQNDNFVTHIRVSPSYFGPHRLTSNSKFYERNGPASVEMSLENLRMAFGRMAALEEQAKQLHEGRITERSHIEQSETSAYAFIHVIPIAGLLRQVHLPVAEMTVNELVEPPSRQSVDGGIDHLGQWRRFPSGTVGLRYSHTGRNGVIEGVMEFRLEDIESQQMKLWRKDDDFELVAFVHDALQFLEENDVPPPVLILTTVDQAVGLKGIRTVERGFSQNHFSKYGFEANRLPCEPVLLEDLAAPAEELMKNSLNTIWNGLGFSHSPRYDDAGNWHGGKIAIDA